MKPKQEVPKEILQIFADVKRYRNSAELEVHDLRAMQEMESIWPGVHEVCRDGLRITIAFNAKDGGSL